MNGFEDLGVVWSPWGEDTREGRFPGSQESYMLPEAAREMLMTWRPSADPSGDL
jgi:hypothetical protein